MKEPIKKEFWLSSAFAEVCADQTFKKPDDTKVISADWAESEINRLNRIIELQKAEYNDLLETHFTQKINKLKKALKEAREQFALMAEGEGNNPKTYQIMSRAAMLKTDEVLKDE